MHSLDSVHISFRNPNHYIYDLDPDEEKYFEVEVEANKTSHSYISIRGRKNGDHFHWDSGLMRVALHHNEFHIHLRSYHKVVSFDQIRLQ
jgi:hypothetical protein